MRPQPLILALTHFLFHCHCRDINVNLEKYLHERAEQVAENLVPIINDSDDENHDGASVTLEKVLQFHRNHRVNLHNITGNGQIFSTSNATFILMGHDLLEVIDDEGFRVHEFRFKDSAQIKAIRMEPFNNNTALILVATDNICHIFGLHYSKRKVFKIQNILAPHFSDAIFFRDHRHLIISSFKSDKSSIYKFTEGHFDEIESMTTPGGAIKLHSFTDANTGNEIIIILRNQPTSSVYEFQNGQVNKIHKMETSSKPRDILGYNHKNQHFVIIFEDNGGINLYLWTGTDLQLWARTQNVSLEPPKITMKVPDPVLIAVNSHHSLVTFDLKDNSLDQIDNFFNLSEVKSLGTSGENCAIFTNSSVDLYSLELRSTQKNRTAPKTSHNLEKNVRQCFQTLEESLYLIRNRMRTAQDDRNNSDILRPKRSNQEILSSLDELNSRYLAAKSTVDNLDSNATSLVVNGPARIRGNLNAPKVTVANLHLDRVNNRKWQPDNWLKYSSPQTITGPVTIRTFKTKSLQAPNNLMSDDKIVEMLQRSKPLIVQKMHVTSGITTGKINGIPLQALYYKSGPLEIKGTKRIHLVTVDEAKLNNVNNKSGSDVMNLLTNPDLIKYRLSGDLKVENLQVETINGVNFNKFRESIYRIDQVNGNIIKGDLTFPRVQTKSAKFVSVNNKSNFLTTSTDQNITANITIDTIFASQDVDADFVNNIEFGKSVATFSDTIVGPVVVDKLNTREDLEVNGDIDDSLFDNRNEHIVGTNVSDLLQIYKGKVTIRGNLFLKNLLVPPSANMSINNSPFAVHQIDEYWSKTKFQVVPVHFIAQNGVSTPRLLTNFINNVAVDDFMLVDGSKSNKRHTIYHFDQVMIQGDLRLNPTKQQTPDLKSLDSEAVKTNGTFTIEGVKKFVGNLTIDQVLNAQQGAVKKIIVEGNLTCGNLTTGFLNEQPLFNKTGDDILVIKNLTVRNLQATTINDHHVEAYKFRLQNMKNFKEIKTLTIASGSVKIRRANISRINDFDVDSLFESNMVKSVDGVLQGDVHFTGNTTVKNFNAMMINDIDMSQLQNRILYKQWNQSISAPFTFTNIKTENLITPTINNKSLNLIDVLSRKVQTLDLRNVSSVSFAKSSTIDYLQGNLTCDLHEGLKSLKSPRTRAWDYVKIHGNVTFWDQDSTINKMFGNVITGNGGNGPRTITGPVSIAGSVKAQNVKTLSRVNDIRLSELVNDALFSEAQDEQVVTGRKTFSTLTVMDKMESHDNTNVTIVNGKNFTEIDAKIVNKNVVYDNHLITGKKIFFSGLQAKNLQTRIISNLLPENLVTTDDSSKIIPHAIFDSIVVSQNLHFKFINHMNFAQKMKKRLTVDQNGELAQQTNATYYFHDLVITGNLETPKINDIEVTNMIFDTPGQQRIKSAKRFTKDLLINGSVTTENINGLKLSDHYENAVLLNEETNLAGNQIILKPSLVKGNINTTFLNNYPIKEMIDTMNRETIKAEAGQIKRIVKEIGEFIRANLGIVNDLPRDFMYLEKSTTLQISVPNTISAQVIESKNNVLIHIGGESNGTQCSLPSDCKCPIQQTMEITSKNSVNVFFNKEKQRIYTHYTDEMQIHLITSTVSSDRLCTANQSDLYNEISSITWNILPGKNQSGGFRVHRDFLQGYISGVEFFTVSGRTYIVVGRYFDPVVGSHSVDSIVFKFSRNKNHLIEIQRITNHGLWTMSLINTAQGVLLIMGTSDRVALNVRTKILRFDAVSEQFGLLREVPSFGSLSAVGVVLKSDSLIILANKHSTLHIFKYSALHDNYYFYQSFKMDNPIYSMSVFYLGHFGKSDAFLSVVTKNDKFYVYWFRFIEGWKLKSMGELEGIKGLVPFRLNHQSYLLAPSSQLSSLLTVVEHNLN